MSTGYTTMSSWLTEEARRITAAGGPNKALALTYIRLSQIVPPHALIHESQGDGVQGMLFTLLNRDHGPMERDGRLELARDIRDATIFLAACTTF